MIRSEGQEDEQEIEGLVDNDRRLFARGIERLAQPLRFLSIGIILAIVFFIVHRFCEQQTI